MYVCMHLLQLNTKIIILVYLVFVHFEVSEGLFVLICKNVAHKIDMFLLFECLGFADGAGGDEGESWSGAGSGRGPYKEQRGTL